jgi:hypothetical protein
VNASTVQLICVSCGERFTVAPADHWKTLCRRCWFAEASARIRVSALQQEVAQLRGELAQMRLSAPSRIDLKRWRQLLALCHPDRNGNSEMATDATRWLLDIREELQQ